MRDDVDIIRNLIHRSNQSSTFHDGPHLRILDRCHDRLGEALPVDDLEGAAAMVEPDMRIHGLGDPQLVVQASDQLVGRGQRGIALLPGRGAEDLLRKRGSSRGAQASSANAVPNHLL